MKEVLAIVAAGALFCLPALAAACAISCGSAACDTAAAATCPAHDGSEAAGKTAPSSGHCPGSRAARAALFSFSAPAGPSVLATSAAALGFVATPAASIPRAAGFQNARHSFEGRSAPIPLRV